jgi:hypothetical protein
VLGRYVESFKFLEVMLSDRPPLSPPELFYQRMLAGDPDEAVEKAEEFLKERSLLAYYDEVALPGLKLAQNDLLRGAIQREQTEKIRGAVQELLDDLSEQEDGSPETTPTRDAEAAAAIEASPEENTNLPVLTPPDLKEGWRSQTPILCVAGRGPLDEAAAAILAQLLGKHGLSTRVEPAEAIASQNLFRLRTEGIALVCISYLDNSSLPSMRYAIRRMRRKLPNAIMLLGCWTEPDASRLQAMVKADEVINTLNAALAYAVSAATDSSGSLGQEPGLKLISTNVKESTA